MQNKLSDFGSGFQIKVISSLLSDINYLVQVSDILKPEYFDNDGNQFIIQKILEYYNEYNKCPSLDALKIYYEKIINDQLKESVKNNLKESYQNIASDDLEIIKKETLFFCRNQVLKQAILDSVDLLEAGKYDEIQVLIDQASQAGLDKNLGHMYQKDFDKRYNQDPRNPIETPWPIINQVTQGGPGSKELWIFAGLPAGGKSWTLINLAAHAMKQGKNVILYTLELSADYVGKRFDSHFTQIQTQKLDQYKEDVKIKIQGIPGQLIIKEYPAGAASVNTLKAHIEKTRATEFNPDMILIDYIDLMKAINVNRNKRDDQILGQLYIDVRGQIAQHYEIPVISASQLNRSGNDEEEAIEGKSIAGSFEKLMHADVVISQNRTTKDKNSKTGIFHFIKSRVGPDGMIYPALIDLSIGDIQIYERDSEEGREIEEMRKTGNKIESQNQNNKEKVNNMYNIHQKVSEKIPTKKNMLESKF